MKTKKSISAWVVEDNALFQKTLMSLINDQKDMKCDRVFSTCEEAVETVQSAAAPDVILHDIGFSGMNGISSVEMIKGLRPKVQIIMVTVFDDDEHIFDALRAGATGYLLKSSTEKIIVDSIRDVIAGGSPMNSSIARKVVEYFSQNPKDSLEYSLSPREKEILELVIRGFSNNMISEKMLVSVHTVDAHLRKIYEKLQVHSRAEAASKALKEKLI
ncbi:MAG: response regulator transcription factor [Bacteroidota bacterium]